MIYQIKKVIMKFPFKRKLNLYKYEINIWVMKNHVINALVMWILEYV